jgi:hypothetical protein
MRGPRNSRFIKCTGGMSWLWNASNNSRSMPRSQDGSRVFSSYTEKPSVNQRGTRWSLTPRVSTCVYRCQAVASHMNSCRRRSPSTGDTNVVRRPNTHRVR